MIDRAFATNAVGGGLNGTSTASSPAGSHRDRGMSLLGSTKRAGVKWGYALGLFQGAGRASDNNSAFGLAVNGNVELAQGLKLTAGLLSSRSEDRGATAEYKYQAWTAGAAFDRGRVFLRGEYYRGTRKRVTDQKVWGYYVLGAYTIVPRVDILVRHQFVGDEQYGSIDNSATSTDVAAKLYFDRRARRSGTHLSVTYMLRDADAAFKKGLTLLNDGRGAALDSGALVGNVLAVRLQLVF
jgi:hypothetical protein